MMVTSRSVTLQQSMYVVGAQPIEEAGYDKASPLLKFC